jgi:hypothetical protein
MIYRIKFEDVVDANVKVELDTSQTG